MSLGQSPRYPRFLSVLIDRLTVGVLLVVASLPIAQSAPLTITEFGQLALRCGPSVAPSTLASIAQTESSFEPFSINDNTTGISGVPATRDIAMQIASKLLETGHSLDVGIMQINSANFAKLGLTLQAAFDPCKSITAGAAVLVGDYAGGDGHEKQQSALRVAISRYNTGDAQHGFANGYVHKVELAAGHLVPALDVGAPQAAIDRQPLQAAAAVPIDPNAPPSWDVWSAYEYAVARPDSAATTLPVPVTAAAVLAVADPASDQPLER